MDRMHRDRVAAAAAAAMAGVTTAAAMVAVATVATVAAAAVVGPAEQRVGVATAAGAMAQPARHYSQ